MLKIILFICLAWGVLFLVNTITVDHKVNNVNKAEHQGTVERQPTLSGDKSELADKTGLQGSENEQVAIGVKQTVTSEEYRKFTRSITQKLRVSELDAQQVFNFILYGEHGSNPLMPGFEKNSSQLRETLLGSVFFVESAQCSPRDRALYLNLLDQLYVAYERWTDPDMRTMAMLSMATILNSRSSWVGIGILPSEPDPEAARFPNKGLDNWYQNSYRTKLQSLGVNSKVNQ